MNQQTSAHKILAPGTKSRTMQIQHDRRSLSLYNRRPDLNIVNAVRDSINNQHPMRHQDIKDGLQNVQWAHSFPS